VWAEFSLECNPIVKRSIVKFTESTGPKKSSERPNIGTRAANGMLRRYPDYVLWR